MLGDETQPLPIFDLALRKLDFLTHHSWTMDQYLCVKEALDVLVEGLPGFSTMLETWSRREVPL